MDRTHSTCKQCDLAMMLDVIMVILRATDILTLCDIDFRLKLSGTCVCIVRVPIVSLKLTLKEL